MNAEAYRPEEIEAESFAIIDGILRERQLVLPEENAPVVKRVVHTTADFDYVRNLYFSPGAVCAGIGALRAGAHIVCDTNMAAAGINKAALARLGGRVHCFMADEDVARSAKSRGVTRAVVCMEKAATLSAPLVIAVGNAPTALLRLHELINTGAVSPLLVIAVPVGFVNVEQSKELFVGGEIPSIVARGRKGGSNVAAAICNALAYRACAHG